MRLSKWLAGGADEELLGMPQLQSVLHQVAISAFAADMLLLLLLLLLDNPVCCGHAAAAAA